MKRSPLLLLLVWSAANADERATTVAIGGMVGAYEHVYYADDYTYAAAEPLVGPRLTLAWEHAPLEMPAQRGVRFASAIVPELLGGAFIDDARAAAFIGAGLRAELKFSQREMGLLRVSARGGVYLAARGLVVGDERKAYGEFAIGEYIYVGRTARIGFEAGVLVSRPHMTDYGESSNWGAMMQALIAWQP